MKDGLVVPLHNVNCDEGTYDDFNIIGVTEEILAEISHKGLETNSVVLKKEFSNKGNIISDQSKTNMLALTKLLNMVLSDINNYDECFYLLEKTYFGRKVDLYSFDNVLDLLELTKLNNRYTELGKSYEVIEVDCDTLVICMKKGFYATALGTNSVKYLLIKDILSSILKYRSLYISSKSGIFKQFVSITCSK